MIRTATVLLLAFASSAALANWPSASWVCSSRVVTVALEATSVAR